MSYSGMRWYKCDLQVQTPGDQAHWATDDPAHLSNCETVDESARKFLRRCHSTELDVIAVTNHNYCGRDYLERLLKLNAEVANECNRSPLTIFPGMEIEIAQGRGIHFLCIFDPNKNLDL